MVHIAITKYLLYSYFVNKKTTAVFNLQGETLASIAAVKYALELAQVVQFSKSFTSENTRAVVTACLILPAITYLNI